MNKQDLKKRCIGTNCKECPIAKSKYLCGCAIKNCFFSFEETIKEVKEEIEKVEKECK